MSWKAVEMQVALPRTQDAGKIQDQMQQQGRIDQNQLAKSMANEELRKRKQVLEQEASEQLKNNKQKRDNSFQTTPEDKKKDDQQRSQFRHPYLGNKVDFNG
ncbi:hypothetical protein SAMN04487943_11346 [Gracilibacillus orientalis]|uniref:Uncharacterized protein n=1 Tax=Gracilibacillus orientalis TaxID=334253 RepID=A0A1I4PWU4_9BACI|nr:hypothetical protein [Gracilibacillus orientalis]SFM31815.1 hypothetical protein SAMN04487943_11346 [Gracilibacillus orientalis]